MNNTITIDNVPSGFELTGEYRGPRAGEYFLSCNGDAHSCDIDCLARYPILRKLEPPEPPAGWELTGISYPLARGEGAPSGQNYAKTLNRKPPLII